MTPEPRWPAGTAPPSAQLRQAHLLLLPADTDAQDVDALVVTRYPRADLIPGGGIRINRYVSLHGPFLLDEAAAREVEAPSQWPLAYALLCPVEREDPPWPGTSHPDGLHRAFWDGMPVRAEARAVDLVVALARRLDGAVRVAGSGVVLRPDPLARPDLAVHSPYWLDPETVLGVVQGIEPRAFLAVEGADPAGPPPGLVEAPPDDAAAALPEDVRLALHAAADQADAEALAAPDALDAYAVAAELSGDGSVGLIEVRVHGKDEDVPALTGLDWADNAVTYDVHWVCPDPRQASLEHPSPEHVAARDVAVPVLHAVADALLEASDGVLVDSDGFLLSPP